MPAKPNTSANVNAENRAKRAYNTMAEIRSTLYRRLVDYVLANEGRIRSEVKGEDTYSFTLQQMDEHFLNKLNIVERAVAELSRCEHREGGQVTTTTYEAIEVLAKREELPQKVADALAEHGESDFLDMCVLRADDKMAEVLLVLAREDSGTPPAAIKQQKQQHGEQGEQNDDQAGSAGGSSDT